MPEIQKVSLKIPTVWNCDVKVDGNKVERLLYPEINTEIHLANTNNAGVLLATSNAGAYLERFLVVKSSKCDIDAYPDLPVLKVKNSAAFNAISSETEVIWLRSPACFIQGVSPIDIAKSWINKFSFKEEDLELGVHGLRTPQVGALHAISAEFSKSNIGPSTVVLPTGTGKTETMLSTAIYHRCRKVLVLVPSNSLRDQIGEKFKTLGCLKELGVIEKDTLYPAVTKIKHGIKSSDDAKQIVENSNVIIATPQILNSKFSKVF